MAKRAHARSPVFAGAIRWDGWAAIGSVVGDAIQVSLGLPEFYSRAPFCARPRPPSQMNYAACASQAAMDAEISYADLAGIRYWAFCWYGESSPMGNGWRLYQASINRHQINWCLLLQFSRLGGPAVFIDSCAAYRSYFQQPNYQKVLAARPLLYIFIDQPDHLGLDWQNNWPVMKGALENLSAPWAPRPYIVIMASCPQMARHAMDQLGADAISNYTGTVPSGKAVPYSAMANSVQNYWVEMAATGAPIVPICMTGWDTRPRQKNPPPWERPPAPASIGQNYIAPGTAAQIARHVLSGLCFVIRHPAICPARTFLIYSWNECDEGGSPLIPTYTHEGPNTSIAKEVGKVLKNKRGL